MSSLKTSSEIFLSFARQATILSQFCTTICSRELLKDKIPFFLHIFCILTLCIFWIFYTPCKFPNFGECFDVIKFLIACCIFMDGVCNFEPITKKLVTFAGNRTAVYLCLLCRDFVAKLLILTDKHQWLIFVHQGQN